MKMRKGMSLGRPMSSLLVTLVISAVVVQVVAQHRDDGRRRAPEARRHDPRRDPRVRRPEQDSWHRTQKQVTTVFDEISEEANQNWGEWGPPSKCSRPCKGGVQYKQRECLEPQGRCVGPSRIYNSCNVDIECPEEIKDFRAVQCSRLNARAFNGKYYSWKPHYPRDHRICDLLCEPKDAEPGVQLIERPQVDILDGTPCYRDEQTQICVESQCMVLGCDGLLGSPARDDKCHVCNGNNTKCNTKTQVFDEQVEVGYQPVAIIPAGATNINIRELVPSRNFLVLRDKGENYYLNGNWRIDYARGFTAAGAAFYYRRSGATSSDTDESLNSKGPTNETLVLMLLVQEANRGVEYEYSLPSDVSPYSTGEYAWSTGEWNDCTDPCSSAPTHRLVNCTSVLTGRPVEEKHCDPSTRPRDSKKCKTDKCPSSWYASDWEPCSNSCGNGTQTRSVFCSVASERESGSVRVLGDRLCANAGEKPVAEQECSSKEGCYRWEAGDWSECDVKCGPGHQKREIQCFAPLGNSTEEGVELMPDGSLCDEDEKPESERECQAAPCSGYEWAVSNFTTPEGNQEGYPLNSQMKTRKVACVDGDGNQYNETFCQDRGQMPVSFEEVTLEELYGTDEPPKRNEWFASVWSKCSAKCGEGLMTRTVFCASFNNGTVEVVDNSECDAEFKPVASEKCVMEACEKEILYGPLDAECPVDGCGGFVRSRKMFCYSNGKPEDCGDSKTTFKVYDNCNLEACPEDKVQELDECAQSANGCCPDGATKAGENFEGCPPLDRANITDCATSAFGCCTDGVTPALKPFREGCEYFGFCNATRFGCCKDGETKATGPNMEGCPQPKCAEGDECCVEDGADEIDEIKPQCQNSTLDASAQPDDAEADSGSGAIEECTFGDFGCCPDGKTAAEGPNYEGCGIGARKVEVELGSGDEPPVDLENPDCEATDTCCPDGITNMTSPMGNGCPLCTESPFGCCAESAAAARGPFNQGCPDVCSNSTFGCCPDNITPKQAEEGFEGCPVVECTKTKFGCCSRTLRVPALSAEKDGCDNCTTSMYGCCKDETSFALGPDFLGCCKDSEYGCCPDGKHVAQGPDLAGCPCESMKYGCCPDKVTPALGPNNDGCTCEHSPFGCCQDYFTPATGPNLEGCACNNTLYKCCDDGVTPALGWNQDGCDCRITRFGCCPDGRTSATGPHNEGCYCDTMKFGCCDDGRTPARGPHKAGCPCHTSEAGCCQDNYTPAKARYYVGCPHCSKQKYGCCFDGKTPARGEDMAGCPCDTMPFGCCPDGLTPAQGPENKDCPDPSTSDCRYARFGCCPDRRTPARGPNNDGCPTESRRRPISPGSPQHPQIHPQHHQHPQQHHHQTPDQSHRRDPYEEHRRRQSTTTPAPYQPKYTKEACTQPQERGPCAIWTASYAFNASTGKCDFFYYGGCGGNDNRFPDENSCLSLCVGEHAVSTQPPRPQYPPQRRPDPDYNPRPEYIDPEEEEDIEENDISPRRPYDGNPCNLPMEPGQCGRNEERFYYDQFTNQCRRFSFGGCRGNQNNFANLKECANRCVRMSPRERCTMPKESANCTAPRSLYHYDYVDQKCREYRGCSDNVNVFTDITDCENTCRIPQMQNIGSMVCQLPQKAGECRDYTLMWYFNSETRRCDRFHYGGCDGNANRFHTQQDCERACAPPAPAHSRPPCEQPLQMGNCRDFVDRWYFDQRTRRCSRFKYGGCGGNHNNFDSQEQCQQTCESRYQPPRIPVPSSGSQHPFTVSDCLLDQDKGPCNELSSYYYYERKTGVCKAFYYGGCGGNNNRFKLLRECENQCREAQDPCKLPTRRGLCSGRYKQYTYDADMDVCKPFDYGGCGGNGNRFDSKQECESRCVRGITSHLPSNITSVPDKCHQPRQVGGCRHSIDQFYFDLQRGTCLHFSYSGCEGNDNRFETINDCEKECKIPAIQAGLISKDGPRGHPSAGPRGDRQDVCRQRSNPGDIDCGHRQDSERYFYDSRSERCLQFIFTGCGGNENNFHSAQECEDFCRGVSDRQDHDRRTHDSGHSQRTVDRKSCPQSSCNDCPIGEMHVVYGATCTVCICRRPDVQDACTNHKCEEGELCDVRRTVQEETATCRPAGVTSDRSNGASDDDENGNDVNEYGVQRDSAEDSDKEAPRILPTQPIVIAALGETANLTCKAVGTPFPRVSWSKGEISLPKHSSKYKQLPTNTLQVFNIDESDMDMYVCTASNGKGKDAKFHMALIMKLDGGASKEQQEKAKSLAQQAKSHLIKSRS